MGRARISLSVIFLIVAVGLAMAGCGYSTLGADTTPTVTPIACASPTASASAARRDAQPMRASLRFVPITTLPPGITPGQVRVVVEAGRYGPCDPIPVWAGNGLGQSISTTDHHSDCTIVTLERQVDSGWQPVANCLLASPTHIVIVPSMQAEFVRLEPSATGAQAGAWPTGTYRVAFGYHVGQEQASGAETTVYSPTFTVA
jgi:hypothetical protein